MNMKDRLRRLERTRPDPDMGRTRRDAAAADFIATMSSQIDRFSDADAELPREALLRMSIRDHWAWTMRFLPDSANLATLTRIYLQHGRRVPDFLAGDRDCEGAA